MQALADAPTDSASRLLDAAERCMQRYGLRRVSMGDVAAEAGMSRGSIYNLFGDRQTLVDAVLERTADRFVASSQAAVDRRRTLAGQVGEAAAFIAGHLDDRDVTLRLPGQLVERWIEFWLPRLAAAEARGEVRSGLDHRRAAEWIVRLMLSFAVMPSATIDLSDADDVRSFVKDHLRGFT